MNPVAQKLLKSFFNEYDLKTFAKGEMILRPESGKIFFLTKGAVRMFTLSKEKEELTLNIHRAYSLFPMSLIFNIQNKYTFDSLTETQGYFAPKKDFKKFINKNPAVLFDLLKRIYLGFDGFFMLLEALLSGDAFYRVLIQLIIYTRRFGQKNGKVATFNWNLTHRQLASQTGLARESVTKEIKKLQDRGLVGYSGKKLFINDVSELEKEQFSYLTKKEKFNS
ncbi:MAG: Crp/Fnr family transcriptional regulator [Candidatus Levybacteria bacterium]|nr:Crp/Fnr family transcriptional regulator [Candidatus Levybacteria bacterium]